MCVRAGCVADGSEEVLLAGEAAVDSPHADTCTVRDLLHRDRRASLCEELVRCLEDALHVPAHILALAAHAHFWFVHAVLLRVSYPWLLFFLVRP
jgi:hypothetical protein